MALQWFLIYDFLLFHMAVRNRSGGCNGQFDQLLFGAVIRTRVCMWREQHNNIVHADPERIECSLMLTIRADSQEG